MDLKELECMILQGWEKDFNNSYEEKTQPNTEGVNDLMMSKSTSYYSSLYLSGHLAISYVVGKWSTCVHDLHISHFHMQSSHMWNAVFVISTPLQMWIWVHPTVLMSFTVFHKLLKIHDESSDEILPTSNCCPSKEDQRVRSGKRGHINLEK